MGRPKKKETAPCPTWIREGMLVDYCSIIGRPPTKRGLAVRGAPQLHGGTWVVWLVGIAGSVAADAVVPHHRVDLDDDRKIIKTVIDESTKWALSEPYDYGEASRGSANGAVVVDVLTEKDGAGMYERVLPDHARFVMAASERWPAALREIEMLRELVRDACELATTHRMQDRVRILSIRQQAGV